MNPSITRRLELCRSLPSLPAAAFRIVELASDPSTGMREVADAVSMDPALSAKIMRMANSSLYARQRSCDTFQQALVRLGLNATLSLSLTFSLVNAMREEKGAGLDYELVWKRSLIAGTAARVVGMHFGIKDVEDLFLAGLLQDIGMLALDRAYPELYAAREDSDQDHDRMRTHERAELETDHAEVGQWLMAQWKLPARIVDAIGASHRIQLDASGNEEARFRQAVALSGVIADVWMTSSPEERLSNLQLSVLPIDGLAGEPILGVLQSIADETPEIERMFEIDLMDQTRSEWILHEARETLMLRNLQMMQESTQLREVAASLKAQAQVLEEKSQRDNLTGAYNRGHLDTTLVDWFTESTQRASPLSLLFIDLDDFKQVNDLHGHQAGDAVLERYGSMLLEAARGSDMAARYGGEEFVVLLRDCNAIGARRFCSRLLERCRAFEYVLDSGEVLKVTASLGVATHGERIKFTTASELLRAADDALYKAKQAGKNCFVEYEVEANAA